MAILYPDILEHNNPAKALVDITQLRGTSYPLGTLAETGSIPTDKRKLGSIIFVSSSQEFYGYYGQTTGSSDWDNIINWRPLSVSTGSFTGSFSGSTADFTNLTASNALITNNVTVLGTASIAFLNVTYESASVIYSTGSNQLGDAANDTQTLYGSVIVPTGSLTVSGNASITGSISIGTTAQSTVALSAGYGSSSNLTVGTTSIYTTYQIANGNTDHVFYTRGASGTTVERLRIKGSAAITDLQVTSSNFIVENNALYVSASGNVGIGISSPSQKLEVNGNIKATKILINTTNAGYTLYSAGESRINDVILTNSADTDYIQKGSGAGAFYVRSAITSGVMYVGANNSSNLFENYLKFDGGANTATLRTNGTDRVYIASSGNVGVGITSPAAKLQVVGTGTTSATTSLLVQNANASSSLVVLDNGNVGIGTTTPSSLFTVNGTSVIREIISIENTSNNTPNYTSVWSFSNNKMSGFIGPSSLGSGGLAHHGYTATGDNSTNPLGFTGITGGTSPTVTSLLFRGGKSNGVTGVNPLASNEIVAQFRNWTTDLVTILGNGNVGIGTITPSASLHISGASSANLLRIDSPASSSILFVSGSGNVGIGTSSPSTKLEILSTDTTGTRTNPHNALTITAENGSLPYNGFGGGIVFKNRAYTAGIVDSSRIRSVINNNSIDNSGGSIAFDITSTVGGSYSQAMLINYNGNVGIGTLTPTQKLDVAGNIKLSNNSQLMWRNAANNGDIPILQLTSTNDLNIGTTSSSIPTTIRLHTSSTERLRILSTGEVGIGTTTPSQALTVAGNISASGDLNINSGANQIWIGDGFTDDNPNGVFKIYNNGISGVISTYYYNSVLELRAGVSGSGFVTNWTKLVMRDNNNGLGAMQFFTSGSERAILTNTGNFGIGTSTPGNLLTVNGNTRIVTPTQGGLFAYDAATGGSFIWSLTRFTAFNPNDLNVNALSGFGIRTGVSTLTNNGHQFYITSGGNVGIGTTSPSASLHVFGTTILSGSAGTGSALTVYKSGSTVMSIQGSQGELFSITDSLSGSLFSVSNISGLPILEVFSDNTVLLGSYLDPMLMTTQRVTANSGSTVIYSLPTSSYDGIFVDYVIRSGSNARAGQFMGMWSGSTTTFTDNSTTDFGSTSGFIFGLVVSGSNMVLTGSASTSGWTVRAGIRSI